MTENNDIPDNRCGVELVRPRVFILGDDYKPMGDICCWRKTWRDTARCVWHVEIENKSVEELKSARADGPERLDGAYLVGVKADNELSFCGCVLRSAIFSEGKFSRTQFYNTDLTRAKFHNTDLTRVEFQDTDLSRAEFHDADLHLTDIHGGTLEAAKFHGTLFRNAEFRDTLLNHAKFHDADIHLTEFHVAHLSYAEFHDANFHSMKSHPTKFHDGVLNDAEFHNASLSNAKFHETDLSRAEFHDATLNRAEFHGVNLSDAEFHNADLHDADCTDAVARRTDFTYATLHDTVLIRADCRGAAFTSALLYETVFADTRINSQTTFHNPEATFYSSITSRPAVVYEENLLTSEDLPENTHPLEAAEWVYRRLEKLHDENALSEEARDFHISKEEVRRKYQRESGEYARYAVSTLQWYVTGHGESIPRIFRSAAILILVCGGIYPFVGGFESSSASAAYRLHPFSVEFSRTAIGDTIATVLQSIYFSVITFTTIGYGDLYPTGAGSKILVGFESLSGAILIALFVFVLGRRVAR